MRRHFLAMTPARARFFAQMMGCAAILLAGGARAQDGLDNDRRMMQMDLAPIFFPPVPPPLGRLVSRLATSVGGRFPPPPELAAYVNEPFYPQLGTRLAKNNLPDRLRQKLAGYRAAKMTLQGALRNELERTSTLEPAERRAALEALARKQAPALAALETTAEELRSELITGDNDWSAYREWRLGGAARGDRGDSPNEVAQVMRATSYYQAGLVPAQRRLLREIFLEVALSAEDESKAAAAQPFLFFPPEPARVVVPDDIPADLAALVADFQTKKSALKKELYDLVYKEDNATFNFARTNSFRALASQQAARIADVERLAEQIRTGLAQLPDTSPPPLRSPLPPALTQRVAALRVGIAELQADTRNKLDAVGTQLRDVGLDFSYQFGIDGIKTVVVPRGRRSQTGAENSGVTALRAQLAAIEEDYRKRNDALNADLESLRKETAANLGKSDSGAVDDALNAATRYVVQRDNDEGYHDYRVAVFAPGLSPEQRRLLFDAAMEKLALPLPRGDQQPTRRAAMW